MSLELQRSEWEPFLNGLSRNLDNWDTIVHVLDPDRGAQLLAARMPFHGLTLENISGTESIGVFVGFGSSGLTHNIHAPIKINYAERGRGPAGTLDIEDAEGKTTLITFIEPHQEPKECVPTGPSRH